MTWSAAEIILIMLAFNLGDVGAEAPVLMNGDFIRHVVYLPHHNPCTAATTKHNSELLHKVYILNINQ